MMISSNVDQPTFCATLNAVGSHEPRCPSGARRTTIPGTRASAPIAAAIPSRTLPDDRADEDREHRRRQRERRHEQRADHDHEQRDRQVPPEQQRVERAEDLEPLGHGADPPARSPVVHEPESRYRDEPSDRLRGCEQDHGHARLPRRHRFSSLALARRRLRRWLVARATTTNDSGTGEASKSATQVLADAVKAADCGELAPHVRPA